MSRSVEELRLIASFADALPAAIWVGRVPSGECVYVNVEFERVLGLRPPEDAAAGNYVGPYGVHTRTGEVYPEDQMPYPRALRARGPVMVDDLVIHRHDGTRTYLRVFASPLFDAAGEIAYVVEAFIDITREVEAEAQRERGERELQHMRRMEALGSLAGGIAHDFNNLLSIVTLISGSLRRGESSPRKLAMLSDLDDVARSATQLTRGLLGFAGRGKNLASELDAGSLVRAVVELAARTFDRRLVVTAELAAEATTIVGDATQLEQVVMNLLLNARDAIAGEGRIVVRTRDVELTAPRDGLTPGRYLSLEVEDSGPGIDPGVRDRVFEPYVTTKTMGADKGTGLGLATVFGIAQAHGGRAEIAVTGPGGTTMRVLFPALEPGAAAARPTPRDGTIVPGTGTVLVVDDEPLVLKATATTLGELGYDVVTAPDGVHAVEVFRAEPGRFCAVLLDLSMPRMSGRETYLALRALRGDVPVILTTGYAFNEEAQKILDLGVRAFLAKPFDPAQLSQTLASLAAAD